MAKKFSRVIRHWYDINKRDLPWRKYTDPYTIWLSEILLQQTRVDQGMPYFYSFKKRFPELKDLADADLDEVLKLWQGLGYYSRARNLHDTAQFVVNELNSRFPDSYKGLLALKGVGDYTASAIASIAFGLPHPVVDGNVIRVVSRYFGVTEPVDGREGKAKIKDIVNDQLDQKHPGDYNQAIMEFGSLQCTPRNPECQLCPLKTSCYAYSNDKVMQLPLKGKRTRVKEVGFHFMVIRNGTLSYIEQRPKTGIWNSMYQFPLLEVIGNSSQPEEEEIINWLGEKGLKMKGFKLLNKVNMSHQLSHRKITAVFWEFEAEMVRIHPNSAIFELEYGSLEKQYAIPQLMVKYLSSKPKPTHVH